MREELQKKIEQSVKLLQTVAKGYDQPIEVAYSGGKDSDVILQLAREAGIAFRAIYRNTTIDPPRRLRHTLVRTALRCGCQTQTFSSLSGRTDSRTASVVSAAAS